MQKEFLDSFEGKKNVWHIILDNGIENWLTQEVSFADETCAKGACKLNTVENESKHVLFLFNDKNEEAGRYYIGKKLQGKTLNELVQLKDQMCFFESYNPKTKKWVPCVGFSSKESPKKRICKEGCGRVTIFRDGYYSVIDKQGNIIVPPGRYTYIDGFDHNLARVKIDGMTSINNPKESTKDKWGIIDIDGKEVLPLVYSEIWGFYNKDRRTTKVVELEHKISGDGDPYIIKTIYEFRLFSKKLVETGYWINDEYFEAIDDNDLSDQYSIWDALDGEPDAAGNIDYEW